MANWNWLTDSSQALLPVAVLLGLVFLYLGRQQAHRAILSLCRVGVHALRLAARSLLRAEDQLRQRNREVLLAEGLREVEQEIEREFHRVEATVKRDLQSYPAFHRRMDDLITRIDDDYRQSTEVPPAPPAWLEAVSAIAKVPEQGDGGVATVLQAIHQSLDKQQAAALATYRQASRKRHALLGRLMPLWRKLGKTLEQVGKTIDGLQQRAARIDGKMAEYEEIQKGTAAAERRLATSALTQFVISGLVVLIAIGGAIINFNLIALPMSEMVGGGSYIGPFRTADVAGLVIILVEVSMGLFLMESLRITKLFPVIGQLDDRLRRRMIWISFSLLLTLAGVESALAFMRDQIAADMEALRQNLAGAAAVAHAGGSMIPTIGQMLMGFILPFALTFVAIPLESFIHSARTVLGAGLAAGLRMLVFTLRLLAGLLRTLGQLLVNLYDLTIFPLLWLEGKMKGRAVKGPVPLEKEAH